MATNDVPGFNPANNDQLHTGCWAEHADGSLIFVKGLENGSVVYEIYDVAHTPVVYYADAMREAAFKTQFSWKAGTNPPTDKWTWHDKTSFPWDRVMRMFSNPAPQYADAESLMSAAARVADALKLRARNLNKADVEAQSGTVGTKGRTIMERITKAVEAFNS